MVKCLFCVEQVKVSDQTYSIGAFLGKDPEDVKHQKQEKLSQQIVDVSHHIWLYASLAFGITVLWILVCVCVCVCMCVCVCVWWFRVVGKYFDFVLQLSY